MRSSASVPAWAVVTVPFPFVDRRTKQGRPALVVSTEAFQLATGLCWLVLITSAVDRPWPGDIRLDDAAGTGLTKPSIIRTAKIAVAEIEAMLPIGTIELPVREHVRNAILSSLAAC